MYSLTLNNFQQSFNHVVNIAKNEPVEIKADDGSVFVFQLKNTKKSPLDIEGIAPKKVITLDDVLDAVAESRSTI